MTLLSMFLFVILSADTVNCSHREFFLAYSTAVFLKLFEISFSDA